MKGAVLEYQAQFCLGGDHAGTFLSRASDGFCRIDRPTKAGRCLAGRFLGLLVAGVMVAGVTLSVSASAQTAPPAFKPYPAAQEQKIGATPQTQEEWRKAMSRTPPPHKGCFTAAFPEMEWVEAQCAPVTAGPHYPVQGTAMGNNNTFVANIIGTGSVSAATGSFDSVSVTGETDLKAKQSDTFSLQLNTNYFQVSLCNWDFCGWQQFVFASQGCGGQDCVFIEYWLRDWAQCPTGWTLISDVGNRKHCHIFTLGMTVPHQPITSLGEMILAGSLQNNSDPTLNTVTAKLGTVDDGCSCGWRFPDLTREPFLARDRIQCLRSGSRFPSCLRSQHDVGGQYPNRRQFRQHSAGLLSLGLYARDEQPERDGASNDYQGAPAVDRVPGNQHRVFLAAS